MDTVAEIYRKYTDFFLALVLLAAIFYIPRQLFANGLSFHADEITLNYWSWRNDWQLMLRVFPTGQHDDRPIGMLFINLLYELFGFNYRLQLCAILFIHYINSILLFKLSNKVIDKKYISIIIVLVFALHYPANSATYYIGAIFDVLCCTFMLLTIICYLGISGKIFDASKIFSVLFFYLSLRSKEMTLLLPISLILLDLTIKTKSQNFSIKNIFIKNLPYLMVSMLVGCIVFVNGLYGGVQLIPTDRYYMDFSFNTCMVVFNHYFSLLSWIPEDKYPFGIFLFLLAAGLCVRNKILLWACLSFFLILFPVLFFKNRIPDIFLYVPHVFFSIGCGCLINLIFNKIKNINYELVVIVCVFVMLSLTFSSKKYSDKINNEITNRRFVGSLILFLTKKTHIEDNTKLYMTNVPIFYMRKGKSWHLTNIINIIYDNDTLSFFTDNNYQKLYNDYIAAAGSNIFLRYDYGFVDIVDIGPNQLH